MNFKYQRGRSLSGFVSAPTSTRSHEDAVMKTIRRSLTVLLLTVGVAACGTSSILGPEIQPGTGNIQPGTGNIQPGTGNIQPGTGNIQPGTGNAHGGVRG